MMPLTRNQKKQEKRLLSYKRQLLNLRVGLESNTNVMHWKWAALELFKELGREFPHNLPLVQSYREEAMKIIMDAHKILN